MTGKRLEWPEMEAVPDDAVTVELPPDFGKLLALAAPVLFCSQGTIYLITSLAGNVISAELMNEITIVGGVLIVSSGFAILNIKDCKTVNMLPALLFPILFFGVKQFF